MKRFLLLAVVLTLVCSVTLAQATSSLTNPMVEYDTYEAMCAALPNVTILPAPADAEDIRYFVINNAISEIQFTWKADATAASDAYTLRAAALRNDDELDDLHGVYIRFEMDKDDDAFSVKIPETVDDLELEFTRSSADALLSWFDEITRTGHSLYSTTAGYSEMRIERLLQAHPEYLGAAAVSQPTSSVPNPMMEYDTYEAMCAALPNVTILPAPADAEAVRYFVIDNAIAEIQFNWKASATAASDAYILRAAAMRSDDALDDLHGVYINFELDMDDEDLRVTVPHTVEDLELEFTRNSADALLSWFDEATRTGHSLYSPTAGYSEMRIEQLIQAHPEYLGM